MADPGGPASPHGFPRVARLDADVALRQLADVAGVRLELEGPCPGGQVGAAYVRWPDGRRSVLTSGPPGSSSAARRTESLLAVGRAHGVPAPRYELVQELPDVPECLPGDDLVHFDFHPENVLVDPAGAVTGVVDWDGAGRSHGYFDLFTLRFDLARRAPELGRWLAAQLQGTAPDGVVLACWAHLSLHLVDWSIRHFSAPYVTTWLGVAESLRP